MAGIGDFNFDDLKDMQKVVEAMDRDFPRFMDECIREIAGRLLAKTIARSPVGVTGDLRRGWTIGQIQRTATGVQIEIINPVEYSLYVEYGHRTPDHMGWVDGKFMLTLSIKEIEEEMPKLMDRKMQQFIDKHMR
ncbi:HK97 gp10 family phage protein [Paenibacillus gansuensis]|uniref:HK97 gp10 family phage protein n=1 Tax=Paenibacillus gansuensis TaxID=306542 RepID=A0ABW5PG10_9BACL